jgi:ABC-type phosphate transport system auxiliary subunit
MQGVPRYGLRTRADYDLLLGLATQGEIRPQGVATLKRHLEGLLVGRFTYVYDRELAEGESSDGELPDYRVLSVEDEETGETRRVQMKHIESPQAEIFRLGFTVPEVEQAITDLEAV